MLIIQTHIFILDLELILTPDALLYQLCLYIVYPMYQPHHRLLHHDISQCTALIKEKQLVISRELNSLLFDHFSLLW